MLFTPSLPAANSAFDLTTVTFISAIIFLSVLSLGFIFHLRFRSRSFNYRENFNSLWTVRFLLVLFIFLWSLTELLRITFFRRRYLFPFLSPSTTSISYQANICKLHLVLNLGFFEPAFLVTLLFLLNASTTATAKNNHLWTIASVLLTCLPITTLQFLLVFLISPLEDILPALFHEPSVVVTDASGSSTVLCAYPLLNSVAFAGFGVAYSAWFLFSCWRVLSLVINKGLRVRIYGLAAAILVAIPVQVVALGASILWTADQEIYDVVSLVAFLGAFFCAATGEGFMVIKPISDALDAGGCCRGWWRPRDGGDGGKVPSSPPEKVVASNTGEECV